MLKWIVAHKIACIITALALVAGGTTGGVVYHNYQIEQQKQEETKKSLEAIQSAQELTIEKQNAQIEQASKFENIKLPEDADYMTLIPQKNPVKYKNHFFFNILNPLHLLFL